jgi:hypothetical protein
MATNIADKLAALRAARKVTPQTGGDSERITLPDGSLSIHDDVFISNLQNAGRDDIEFLLTRPVDEREAILQAVELNQLIQMRFLDYD